MRRYLFNREFFSYKYKKELNKTDRLAQLAADAYINAETLQAKIAGKRLFKDDDLILNEHGPFLLDTEKLLYAFLERVNIDFTPNEKYVMYIMLIEYDSKKKGWNNIDELAINHSFNKQKVQAILKNHSKDINAEDDLQEDNLFYYKENKGAVQYCINITALINYCNSLIS